MYKKFNYFGEEPNTPQEMYNLLDYFYTLDPINVQTINRIPKDCDKNEDDYIDDKNGELKCIKDKLEGRSWTLEPTGPEITEK